MLIDRLIDHGPCLLHHVADLGDDLFQRDRRRRQKIRFQRMNLIVGIIPDRQDSLAEPREEPHHRQQNQDREDIEERMRHRDMPFQSLRNRRKHIPRRDRVHKIEEHRNLLRSVRNVETDDQQHRSDAVEQKMSNRRLLGDPVGGQRCQKHRDRRSDIGPQQQRHRRIEIEQTARGEREHDAQHR